MTGADRAMSITSPGLPGREVLFVHNGPIYRAANGGLYGTHITDALRRRYLGLGDKVHFLMREKPIDGDLQRLSPIQDESFRFTSVPEVLTPTRRFTCGRRARQIIRKAVIDSDIVVARVPSLIARWAIHYAQQLGKPYMIECVACNWDALSNHKWSARLLAPWYFLAQKRVLKYAPFVIYVTRQFLQQRYPTRGLSFSISNVELTATNSSVLDRRIERVRTRQAEQAPIRLVTVASVSTPYKGQADVIAALGPLSAAGVDCEYHLVGGGEQTRLRALSRSQDVGDKVYFHGAVRHAEVFDLLDGMDIYIQPSRQEGLPRAVIEAMSRGLPALGARTGGIPELLPDARIFAPGDIEGVIRTVTTMLHKGVLEADAERNFREAKRYTSERLAETRREAYQAFLELNQLAY